MATTPGFANTPKAGMVKCSTANTNRDGTGSIGTILTAGVSGTKIDEIVVQADNNPADSIITIFIKPGTTSWRIYDEFDLGDPAAGSATVTGYRDSKRYESLVLPSTAWLLGAAVTATPTAGAVNVWAFGANF